MPRTMTVGVGTRWAIAVGALALCGLALGAAQPGRAAEGATEVNKRTVLAFGTTAAARPKRPRKR